MTDDPRDAQIHPWLRVQLMIRTLRETRWDAVTWPRAKVTLRAALAQQSRLRRAGWFN